MSDEQRDELARMRAQFDQARESMSELAGTLFRYYSDLIQEGFKADQALTIVVSWQGAMIANLGGSDA